MLDGPCLDKFVLIRVLKKIDSTEIGFPENADLDPGDIYLTRYRIVRRCVLNNEVEML
jgi:hypothetical protein